VEIQDFRSGNSPESGAEKQTNLHWLCFVRDEGSSLLFDHPNHITLKKWQEFRKRRTSSLRLILAISRR
jgi:hypothetical protein